jgi:hypothetical protein
MTCSVIRNVEETPDLLQEDNSRRTIKKAVGFSSSHFRYCKTKFINLKAEEVSCRLFHLSYSKVSWYFCCWTRRPNGNQNICTRYIYLYYSKLSSYKNVYIVLRRISEIIHKKMASWNELNFFWFCSRFNHSENLMIEDVGFSYRI